MIGTLVKGTEPKGPALYVDNDEGCFPVAVKSPIEEQHLWMWLNHRVKFTPKVLGTRTNAGTGKIEAIVFATNLRSEHVN
jgi:hypothetical protein